MATQVPVNEFAPASNRRAAILQRASGTAGDPLRKLAETLRGSEASRVLEDTLPAETAPKPPQELSVWDKMRQEDELKTAALENARAELARMTQELVALRASTDKVITRLSDQVDAATERAKNMEDQRNKFADYTMVLAERLKNIEETSRANAERAIADATRNADQVAKDAEQLSTMIGEARTLAGTAAFQKSARDEPKPKPEGLAPNDMPEFLDRPQDQG